MKLRCLILEAALSVRPVRCGVTCHSCQQLDRVTISVCRLISSSAERGGMSVLTPSATPFPLRDRFCEQRGGGNRLWFLHHPSGGFYRSAHSAHQQCTSPRTNLLSWLHISAPRVSDGARWPVPKRFLRLGTAFAWKPSESRSANQKNRSTEPVQ